MKDNVTGKDKEFYERGKKMFDRLNPPGTPEFKPYFPKQEWVGLMDEEWESMYDKFAKYQTYGAFVSGWGDFARAIEAKLKEKNL